MKRSASRVFFLFSLSMTLMVTGASAFSIAQPANAKGTQFFQGKITAVFGKPTEGGSVHGGVDLAAPFGTPVHAPRDGQIVEATDFFQNQRGWGNVVVLRSGDGVDTLFAHLGDFNVRSGQQIRSGQIIGHVGATGAAEKPHVHIETLRDGIRVDPAEIYPFLDP